jgi:predicted metal-dependent hydrolase
MFWFGREKDTQLNSEVIKLGDIAVKIKKSLRAKNISIKIKPNQTVELVMPRGASFDLAHKFLLEKELWIKNKLGRIKTSPEVASSIPEEISVLGQKYQLITGNKDVSLPIKIEDNKLLISSSIHDDKIPQIIVPFLKKMFKCELEKYAALKAEELNVTFKRISVRDTSSRWGSCSSRGNLSFSWRLVLAPRYVMDYVIVHELSHLIEMNHSHRFWKLVNMAFPEHQKARSWLKINGKKLHSSF